LRVIRKSSLRGDVESKPDFSFFWRIEKPAD
jgi:hypothetical protein